MLHSQDGKVDEARKQEDAIRNLLNPMRPSDELARDSELEALVPQPLGLEVSTSVNMCD